jgi:hypothetical protein
VLLKKGGHGIVRGFRFLELAAFIFGRAAGNATDFVNLAIKQAITWKYDTPYHRLQKKPPLKKYRLPKMHGTVKTLNG